ncbi:MAG: dTDP-4-amino-4,6-dideoxygalactose transaminase [Saprospiraceae bacterium]|nr:dTDP-4-amino-4,6-dideoxygalactose transaminase [Saprospiraceae bacterium]
MNQNRIPLSKPYQAANQLKYAHQVIESGHWSSYNQFSMKCEAFFNSYFGINTCLLTHSCTDALELISLLIELKEGDEVIVPSFTFVSTANAFLLRGAKIIWCDSQEDHPNVSIDQILPLISSKTKAIVVVHYAGVCVDMDPIISLCKSKNIVLVEDAAQALTSEYKGRKAGTLSDFATFSFHDTKPISCGEGGLLVINNSDYFDKAVIHLEKGTDRHAFLQGQVNKYQWLNVGSSYAPSEFQSSQLFAQLEEMDSIFDLRKKIWRQYMHILDSHYSEVYKLPKKFNYSDYNTSIFYVELRFESQRNNLIQNLNLSGISASFHYLALHSSPFGSIINSQDCPNASYWEKHILRLPIHTEMNEKDVEFICENIIV